VFYVACSGNDTAEGTESRPWATLQKAADVAVSGDKVIIKGGTYMLRKGVALANKGPITFGAFPGDQPTFRFVGSDTYALAIGDKAHNITIDGLTLVWATDSNGNIIGIGGEYAIVKNCGSSPK
jgi:hypothetical protein